MIILLLKNTIVNNCQFFIADTDGVWGSWQSWESCSTSSLSCNSSSVYIRERHCDNPPLAGAGQDCQGISQQQTDVGRFGKNGCQMIFFCGFQ